MIKLDAIKYENLETLRIWRNNWQKYFRQYRPLTIADQQIWFNDNSDGFIMFGIYDDNKLIGICGLTYIDLKNRNADLSIYIGDTYVDDRALEALKLLFEYSFNELGLERIYNDLFSYDEKKKEILLKSGMKIEGKNRNRYFRNGKFYDSILFSILKEEFNIK